MFSYHQFILFFDVVADLCFNRRYTKLTNKRTERGSSNSSVQLESKTERKKISLLIAIHGRESFSSTKTKKKKKDATLFVLVFGLQRFIACPKGVLAAFRLRYFFSVVAVVVGILLVFISPTRFLLSVVFLFVVVIVFGKIACTILRLCTISIFLVARVRALLTPLVCIHHHHLIWIWYGQRAISHRQRLPRENFKLLAAFFLFSIPFAYGINLMVFAVWLPRTHCSGQFMLK